MADERGWIVMSLRRRRRDPRRRMLGWRRCRRSRSHNAGAGAVAGRVRPGQAVQDRHAPAALGRRRRRGKTALVGTQMAVDRINQSGGINGRPVELIVADYESKPDVGRRKAEKLVVEDEIDVHQGGFLSNVCLACMPVWEEYQIVNMIGVCLDTTITTSKCSRYTFRPFDYAPAQAVAFALSGQQPGQEMAHRLRRLRLGPVDPRCLRGADQEGGRRGRGRTGIPLGTADMTRSSRSPGTSTACSASSSARTG